MKEFKDEAVQFITAEILANRQDCDGDKCRRLIGEIMDADFEFMTRTKVIVDGEFSPEAYYDDDEAYDFIAERIFKAESEEDESLLDDLLEDYFDYFEKFMAQKGMLDWE